MTQFATGTLRLSVGADTLVLGQRAAFGHGTGLCRLESEDDVRQRLVRAISNPGAIEALRTFWARLFFDTRQITHTTSRELIDSVAVATVRGPLAAYLVPDASVKHMLGAAVELVAPQRPMRRGGARTLGGALRLRPPQDRRRPRRPPLRQARVPGHPLRRPRFRGSAMSFRCKAERSSPARCSSP